MKVRLSITREAAFLIENPEMINAFRSSAENDVIDNVYSELLSLAESIISIAKQVKKGRE